MSKGNTFEDDLLLLLFNGIPITGLADVGVANPANNFYISLHTAALGDTSTQSDNETAYSGYARLEVPRTDPPWDVLAGVATYIVDLTFPVPLASDIPVVAMAIGMDPTGPGKILHYGNLYEPLNIVEGVAPTFLAGKIRIGEE